MGTAFTQTETIGPAKIRDKIKAHFAARSLVYRVSFTMASSMSLQHMPVEVTAHILRR
jgi:hypothetical protein